MKNSALLSALFVLISGLAVAGPSAEVSAVPEPSTFAMLALAGGFFAAYRLRKRR